MQRTTRAAVWTAAALSTAAATGQVVQPGTCPLAPTPAEAELIRQRRAAGLYDLPNAAGRGFTIIPITAHIVRRSDGTGGLSTPDLEQTIADANAHFEAGGLLSLCLVETIYLDSDQFYSGIDTRAEIDAMRTTGLVPGTLNIYFTDRLEYEFGGLCGISAFTFSEVQSIAMNNACTAMTGNTSTTAHEIGHYFDLFHTHEPAFGAECIDGSNCADAADLICDTAADPNILGDIDRACLWTGSASDPCGSALPYDPPVDNLMSYSRKECRTLFTPEQQARMLATQVNFRPNLVIPSCDPGCPASADVNGNGVADPGDFTAWVNAYNAGDLAADQNGNGTLDPGDFTAWISNYNAGCV
ncbi:MAG: GC-type dockerin domain-anchored protein [Phycisphaerales bacterium]